MRRTNTPAPGAPTSPLNAGIKPAGAGPDALDYSTVPLTKSQRFELRFAGLMSLAAAGVIASLLLAFNLKSSGIPWIYTVIGITAMVGFAHQALIRLRDARRGTARVQPDLLLHTREVYNRTARGYKALFDALGWVNLEGDLFQKAAAGKRYLVIYSPASKRIWEILADD